MITTVLMGLQVAKTVTDRKMQFFREASSGYDVTAYYLAINVVATFEHSVQICIAAFFGLWLRNTFANPLAFYINFLLLGWICVGWAIFLSVMVPPETVNVVVGFFMGFSGLLLSGGLEPIEYYETYRVGGIQELFSGLVSPMRFFVEMNAVSESRCLPEQTGYTLGVNATGFPAKYSTMALLGFGINDLENATRQNSNGWYTSVIPAICVGLCMRVLGLGAIHACGRSQQIKKSIWYDISKSPQVKYCAILFTTCTVMLFALTSFLILRHTSDSPKLDKFEFSHGKV